MKKSFYTFTIVFWVLGILWGGLLIMPPVYAAQDTVKIGYPRH